MLHAQYHSPTSTSLMPNNLTLASLNARHSESPNAALPTPLRYNKNWSPNYLHDSRISLPSQYDFQSNSIYEPPPPVVFDATTPALAGLGIHHLDFHSDFKLSFSPKLAPSEFNAAGLFSPRLESSYSLNDVDCRPSLIDEIAHENHGLGSPYSFTLACATLGLVPGDIANDNMAEPMACLPPGDVQPQAQGDNIGSTEDFSIESLSAAAGLSIEEFTARITEGAQYALKQLAHYDSTADPAINLVDDGQETYPRLSASTSTFNPFPDINMLDLSDAWFPPCVGGVNPADIMPAPPMPSSTASLEGIFDVLGQQVNPGDSMPDFLSFPEDTTFHCGDLPTMRQALSTDQTTQPNLLYPAHGREEFSDYEPPPFLSPSSSEYSPSLGGTRQYHTRGTKIKKRKVAQPEISNPHPAAIAGPSAEPMHLPAIDLGSPVFDAHRGISIEDLKARAERYRLRNQGREYDKRWLLSFAGKLSAKGELLEEFRCYITGCQQVNKRRDHILIHVGAHLDQRPFKCIHCSARFLRKNECKRHELSHTGVRPFTCHICPFPATTFVRQDLLRRHMKRTHQLHEDKENNRLPNSRPRKKVRKC